MASQEVDACTNYPDFAVICSFIDNFGDKLNTTFPNIGELQKLLEDTENVSPVLIQTLGFLLRRINKGFKADRWEKGVQKFVYTYNHKEAWELERCGFKNTKLEIKLGILKNLLEKQFDLHKTFKEKINAISAKDLRLQPCGRDKFGVSYWCQIDECANLRVYKDDQDEETWELVARTKEEVLALIEQLQDSVTAIRRETSVDGSQSGTTTPMVLSEAATPVASGRASPVLDDKQEDDKPMPKKAEESDLENSQVDGRLHEAPDTTPVKEDDKLDPGNAPEYAPQSVDAAVTEETVPPASIDPKIPPDKPINDKQTPESDVQSDSKSLESMSLTSKIPDSQSSEIKPDKSEPDKSKSQQNVVVCDGQDLSQAVAKDTDVSCTASQESISSHKVADVQTAEETNATVLEKKNCTDSHEIAPETAGNSSLDANPVQSSDESQISTPGSNSKHNVTNSPEKASDNIEDASKLSMETSDPEASSQSNKRKLDDSDLEEENPSKVRKTDDPVPPSAEKEAEFAITNKEVDPGPPNEQSSGIGSSQLKATDEEDPKQSLKDIKVELKHEQTVPEIPKGDSLVQETETDPKTTDVQSEAAHSDMKAATKNPQTIVSQISQKKLSTTTENVDETAKGSSSDAQKPSTDEACEMPEDAIEEPVMIVKGDGEGASCESGRPWWENFDENPSFNVEDAVQENVMFFCGDGSGADCEGGNDEDKESVENGTVSSAQVKSIERSQELIMPDKSKDNDMHKLNGSNSESFDKPLLNSTGESASLSNYSIGSEDRASQEVVSLSACVESNDTSLRESKLDDAGSHEAQAITTQSNNLKTGEMDRKVTKEGPCGDAKGEVSSLKSDKNDTNIPKENEPKEEDTVQKPDMDVPDVVEPKVKSGDDTNVESVGNNLTVLAESTDVKEKSEEARVLSHSKQIENVSPEEGTSKDFLQESTKQGCDTKLDVDQVEAVNECKKQLPQVTDKINELNPEDLRQEKHEEEREEKHDMGLEVDSKKLERDFQEQSQGAEENSKKLEEEAEGKPKELEEEVQDKPKEFKEKVEEKPKESEKQVQDKPKELKTETESKQKELEKEAEVKLKEFEEKAEKKINELEEKGEEKLKELETEAKNKPKELETEAESKPKELETEAESKPKELETEAESKPKELETEAESKPKELETEAKSKPKELKTEAERKQKELETEAESKPKELKTEAESKQKELEKEAEDKPKEFEEKAENKQKILEKEFEEKSKQLKTEVEDEPNELKKEVEEKPKELEEKSEEMETEVEEKPTIPDKNEDAQPECSENADLSEKNDKESIEDIAVKTENPSTTATTEEKFVITKTDTKEPVSETEGKSEQEGTQGTLPEDNDAKIQPGATSKTTDSDELQTQVSEPFVPKKPKGRGRPRKDNSSPKVKAPLPSKATYKEDSADEEDEEEEPEEEREPPAKKKKPEPEVTRHRSARIAKIREREEAERIALEGKRLEQLALQNKRRARDERRVGRESKKDRKPDDHKSKKKKKKKKKNKAKRTGNDPWAHSSSSSSSSSEDGIDFGDIEEEENEELVFKSDHEFSPESELEDEDAQPIKRARTAIKVKADPEPKSEESDDDASCTKCNHQDHPETILLCDTCDAGWHLSCLRPPLLSVPEGDWTCPSCEHHALIEKLKTLVSQYDTLKKKAENEEMRRQRLAYINISLENALPDVKEHKKRRPKKRKKEKKERTGDDEESASDSEEDSASGSLTSSSSESDSDSSGPLYTLRARPSRTPKEQVEDFDELINRAIRQEEEDVVPYTKKTGVGRGKDIANIMEGEVEDEPDSPPEKMDEDEEEAGPGKQEAENGVEKKPKVEVKLEKTKRKREDSEEDSDYPSDDSRKEKPKPKRKRAVGAKKRRRLTDLDAVDEDEDDSDESFKGSSDLVDDSEETLEESSFSSSYGIESDTEDTYEEEEVPQEEVRSSSSLRRSCRNRRNLPSDYDSEPERNTKKSKGRRTDSSSEDDTSSDDSYVQEKPIRKKPPPPPPKKKMKKKPVSKKPLTKSKFPSKRPQIKGINKNVTSKPKPKVRYSKPTIKQDEEDDAPARKRVTRGRQMTYFDSLYLSDDDDDSEDDKPKSRGKFMKGERRPTESSDYEESDDEMKRRRGVRGGLGKGKVMQDEDEDSDSKPEKKKPPYRGKPSVVTTSKPQPTAPSDSKPVNSVSSVAAPASPLTRKESPPAVSHPVDSLLGTNPPYGKTVEPIPVPTAMGGGAMRPFSETQLQTASSPQSASSAALSITPVPYGAKIAPTPTPLDVTSGAIKSVGSPLPITKAPLSDPVKALGRSSPGPKWSPHITRAGTPPRHPLGSGTPPRPVMSGSVTASPPLPYRSSPLPIVHPGTAHTNVSATMPVTTTHPAYPPYGPPEHFVSHPGFPPGYPPRGSHPPGPPRHPIPPGHSVYGPPHHSGYPPAHHPGVLRGPDMYRHGVPSRGSPTHPPHANHPHPGMMKSPYHSLEPLPFTGSPGPIDATGRGAQESPTRTEEPKDPGRKAKADERTEFSSGLFSYFSSQREEDES